jgi:hypothetical protein
MSRDPTGGVVLIGVLWEKVAGMNKNARGIRHFRWKTTWVPPVTLITFFFSRLAVAERAPNTFCHLCVAFPLLALLMPLPYLLCFHYQQEEDPRRTHARLCQRLVSVRRSSNTSVGHICAYSLQRSAASFPLPLSSPFLVFSCDVAFFPSVHKGVATGEQEGLVGWVRG